MGSSGSLESGQATWEEEWSYREQRGRTKNCKNCENHMLESRYMFIKNAGYKRVSGHPGVLVDSWSGLSVYLSGCGRGLSDDTEHMEPKIL